MKRGWQVATLCLLVFSGLALLIGVFGARFINARPLPLRDALGPGPGFFPMWLSLIVIVLAVLLLLEISRQPADTGKSPYPKPDRATAFNALGAVAVMALGAWKYPEFPLLQRIGLESDVVRATVSSLMLAGSALALAIWPNREPEQSENGAVLRIAAVIGLLILATAMLDPLGFRATAFVFTGLLLIALGARSIKVIVPFTLLASLGVFYVFYHALKVPLPIGPYDVFLRPLETVAITAWTSISTLLSR